MDNEVKEVTFFSENKHLKGYIRTPGGKPPFPAVLMFHGGIVDTEKNTLRMVNGREAEAFLQEGFLVFSADWRTLQDTDDPSKLRRSDALEAYNYLKNMNEVNSSKIVCYGHSAGATTAVWTAIQTQVQGTAAIAGILDYGKYAGHGAAAGKTFITDILFPTLGEDFKKGKRYQLASPIHFAAGIQSPLLIIHGSEDQIVPVEQAYLFEKTLKKYNKDFQMTIVENGSHKVNNYKKTIIRMVEFLKKCLKEN
ncbi:MAG: prolyl oligopeptidase family serine peptidase [Candidatus Aminicenantes bacterium]|nr:MAG: prolyl oligopeptidase family serine peptidase [Candidatus Aminicenantes bacterium]